MNLGKARIGLALLAAVVALAATSVQAQEGPTEVTGKAILAHPAGQALLEAAKLLKAGKLSEVKKMSAKDVREEWAAMSAADQRDEAQSAVKRAPDPAVFVAEVARGGVLTNYGDSAKLFVSSADGNSAILAFVSLESGTWKVTAGPFVADTSPVQESAPALVGEAILEHEIGKQVLAYARALEAGNVEQAMELVTSAARTERLAWRAEERAESDRYIREATPRASDLAAQIRSGGRITFEGERATLIVSTSTQTRTGEGSVSVSTSSLSIPFALENGHWRIAG